MLIVLKSVQVISGLELKGTETDKTELIHWENVTFKRRQCCNQNQIDFPAFKTGFGCKGENPAEYEILAGHCFFSKYLVLKSLHRFILNF